MIGAIIGAGVSAIGSIGGGIAQAKAARRQRRALKAQEQDAQALFDRRYNEDATQRADAQELLNGTVNAMRQRSRAAAGVQSVIGGTDAGTAQTMAENNDLYAKTVGQINAGAAGRKDELEAQWQAQKNGFEAQKTALDAERAANIASATSKMAEAGGQLAGALEDGIKERKNKKNNLGGISI